MLPGTIANAGSALFFLRLERVECLIKYPLQKAWRRAGPQIVGLRCQIIAMWGVSKTGCSCGTDVMAVVGDATAWASIAFRCGRIRASLWIRHGFGCVFSTEPGILFSIPQCKSLTGSGYPHSPRCWPQFCQLTVCPVIPRLGMDK